MIPEAAVAMAASGVVLTGTVGWLSWRALGLSGDDPGRLVAELRLAQFGALALAFVAAVYAGLASAHPHVPGTALDVTLALGFAGLAATAMLREPRPALLLVAAGALAHALVDVAHRPGLLPVGLAPPWLTIGCAVQNVAMALSCYLPAARRTP